MSSSLPLPETLPAHVCGPAHSILHCAPPHWMGPAHDLEEAQVIVQPVAFEQSSGPWQLSGVRHMIVHGMLFGHTTPASHASPAAQSNTQPAMGSHELPPFARQLSHAVGVAPAVPPGPPPTPDVPSLPGVPAPASAPPNVPALPVAPALPPGSLPPSPTTPPAPKPPAPSPGAPPGPPLPPVDPAPGAPALPVPPGPGPPPSPTTPPDPSMSPPPPPVAAIAITPPAPISPPSGRACPASTPVNPDLFTEQPPISANRTSGGIDAPRSADRETLIVGDHARGQERCQRDSLRTFAYPAGFAACGQTVDRSAIAVDLPNVRRAPIFAFALAACRP